MIEPLSTLHGHVSLEHEAHEWAEDIKLLGYAEDWDGIERPGLAVAIAENLPSNEAPATKAWDMPWEMAVAIAGERDPVGYWFFGPSTYVIAMRAQLRAAARSN